MNELQRRIEQERPAGAAVQLQPVPSYHTGHLFGRSKRWKCHRQEQKQEKLG